MAKLRLFAGGHVDGHCPQLTGLDLNAYVAAGIRTEHEATTAEEALEKLRKGMRVLIREGSVSKDLDALQPILTDTTSPYLCLCTDDRNPLDIGEHGHLDYMIRRLIALGTSPLAVYLHGRDDGFAAGLQAATRSGAFVRNDHVLQAAVAELPFGGVGPSGLGRVHGRNPRLIRGSAQAARRDHAP